MRGKSRPSQPVSVLVYDGVSVMTGVSTKSERTVATVMLTERKDGTRGGLFPRDKPRRPPPVCQSETGRSRQRVKHCAKTEVLSLKLSHRLPLLFELAF